MSSAPSIVKSIMTVIGGSLLAYSATATPRNLHVEPSLVNSGVLLCGGTHFFRTNSNQQVRTSYSLRNFSPTTTQIINSVKVFDAQGGIRCDYPLVDPFPATFDPVLLPHWSTGFETTKMDECHNPITNNLPEEFRPLQVVISWSGQPARMPVVGRYSTKLVDADTRQVMSDRPAKCDNAPD